MSNESQRFRLLRHLQSGRWRSMPSCIAAMRGYRLSGRVFELRRQGFRIDVRVHRGKPTVSEYRLVR